MIRRPRSLQVRLSGAVILIVGLALASLSASVYSVVSRGSRDRFDERLAETARAAALLVGRDASGPTAPEAELLRTLDQSRGTTSFEVWSEDGAVLARYAPLESAALRPPDRGAAAVRFETVAFPDGRAARLYRAWLAPGPEAQPPARVGIAVLRDTEHLEHRLARLRAILVGATLATMLLSGLVAWRTVRSAVSGVAQLATRIGAIDVDSLREQLDVEALPDELRPPFTKVNELLLRLEQVLRRERQFSADISHELRTPLAGLRTILEVSGSRERSPAEHRAAVRDALEVVRHLEALVENLLALARLGAGAPPDGLVEDVDVGALVSSCFAPLTDLADRRRLRFESWAGHGARVAGDGLKLRLITSNLLSNAVQYTQEGGWITVESDPSQGVILRVRDSGPQIPGDALARIFDPFFRAERSRSSDGQHFGIGLALVRGLCDSCGYRVTAENEAGGAVTFAVTTPPGSAAAPAGEPPQRSA